MTGAAAWDGPPVMAREGTRPMTRSLTMRPRTMLDQPMRLLAVLAMTAALFAAFLPAMPAAAGVGETPTADLTFQVYTCPDDYAGEDYLTDCFAGPEGYELLVTEDTDSADGPGGQAGVTGFTDADGFSSLNYPAGPTRTVLQLSRETNSFYLACFDTTSGSEVFLLDGADNGLSLDTAGGESFSCRWYVIPSSAGEPAPTTALGTFQVYDCELDYTGDADAAGCFAAPQGIPVRINGDGGNYVQNTQTSQSGMAHDSTIPPGEITVTLDIDETVYGRDTTGFEVECFDASSGTAESLGTTNVGTFDLAVVAGGSYACDFYVTPYAEPAAAAAQFQVFSCPALYEGDTYLNDCDPVGVDVLLSPGTEFDPDSAIAGTAIDDSTTGFGPLDPGSYSAFLNASERVNSFYYACFDTSSGSEVFLFDGEASYLTADIAAGGLLSCRWYIVPQEEGTDSASAGFEVRTCPVAYAGNDYQNDCPPVEESEPVDVLLSGGPVLDPETALVGTTGINGLTTFTPLVPGTYTAGLDVSGEFADFSLACFDASSGSDVFLFDGDANVTTFQLLAYGYTICRWYIIPEDLAGGTASPDASATVAPSASASANAAAPSRGGTSGGPISGLPNTGAGTGAGPALPGAALALAVLAVLAVAFATRRLLATRS